MNGELRLMLPVTPRWGHRCAGLATSAAFHASVIALIVAITGTGDASPTSEELREPDRVVWIPPPPPEIKTPEPAEPHAPPVSGDPVKYAGGAKPKPERDGSNATDATSPADGPSKWREFLPRALELQSEGVRAPAYLVTNLDTPLIASLTARGLALIVAGRPPFRDDPQQVVWAPSGAVGLTSLPEAWGRQAARRGLPLPSAWWQGLPISRAVGVYLVPRAALDAAILAAQLEAAERRGVPLEGLVRTYGRFVPDADGALAYVIDRVDLVPNAAAHSSS